MLDHASLSGIARRSQGVDGPSSYSQTLISGNFYLVLTLVGPEKKVTLKLGHDTITRLEELITTTPEISPKELTELMLAEFPQDITLELLVAKISGSHLDLSSIGPFSAKLFRGNQIINLLPATSHQQLATTNGPLRPHDLLILASDDFFSLTSLTTLTSHNQSLLSGSESITDFRDSFLPSLESSDLSNLSALFLHLPEEIPAEDEETTAPSPTPAPITNDHPPTTSSKSLFPDSNPVSGPKSLVSRLFLQKKLKLHFSNPDSFLTEFRPILYLSLIALITLISLIAFQLRSRSLETRSQVVNKLTKQVTDGLNAAQKLTGLNDSLATQTLLQTKTDFESQATATFGSNWSTAKIPESGKLLALESSLNSQISLTSHTYPVPSLDIFYDFSLLKSGANITSAELHNDQILALDQNNGAVYSLSPANKAATIVTGSDSLKSAQFLDFSGSKGFFFSPSGISQVTLTSPTSPTSLIKPSDKWGKISSLKTFGGNLYLLDPQNNQIWKYQGTDLGFADITNYLKTGLSLDISNVISMAIDGYIYILSKTGSIVRIAGGSPDNFQLTNLDLPLKNPSLLYASDETQNIYILDSGNNRLVVFDKKGAYQSQYLLPATSNQQLATSLLVSESQKKVFLLSKNLVYAFSLK